MDEVGVNRAFFIGFDRTNDLIKMIPEGDEGEAELVGLFIACVNELAERWDMTEKEAILRVSNIIS
jgi:hypothetical protein